LIAPDTLGTVGAAVGVFVAVELGVADVVGLLIVGVGDCTSTGRGVHWDAFVQLPRSRKHETIQTTGPRTIAKPSLHSRRI
jgi:hypothetical protein